MVIYKLNKYILHFAFIFHTNFHICLLLLGTCSMYLGSYLVIFFFLFLLVLRDGIYSPTPKLTSPPRDSRQCYHLHEKHMQALYQFPMQSMDDTIQQQNLWIAKEANMPNYLLWIHPHHPFLALIKLLQQRSFLTIHWYKQLRWIRMSFY